MGNAESKTESNTSALDCLSCCSNQKLSNSEQMNRRSFDQSFDDEKSKRMTSIRTKTIKKLGKMMNQKQSSVATDFELHEGYDSDLTDWDNFDKDVTLKRKGNARPMFDEEFMSNLVKLAHPKVKKIFKEYFFQYRPAFDFQRIPQRKLFSWVGST